MEDYASRGHLSRLPDSSLSLSLSCLTTLWEWYNEAKIILAHKEIRAQLVEIPLTSLSFFISISLLHKSEYSSDSVESVITSSWCPHWAEYKSLTCVYLYIIGRVMILPFPEKYLLTLTVTEKDTSTFFHIPSNMPCLLPPAPLEPRVNFSCTRTVLLSQNSKLRNTSASGQLSFQNTVYCAAERELR